MCVVSIPAHQTHPSAVQSRALWSFLGLRLLEKLVQVPARRLSFRVKMLRTSRSSTALQLFDRWWLQSLFYPDGYRPTSPWWSNGTDQISHLWEILLAAARSSQSRHWVRLASIGYVEPFSPLDGDPSWESQRVKVSPYDFLSYVGPYPIRYWLLSHRPQLCIDNHM